MSRSIGLLGSPAGMAFEPCDHDSFFDDDHDDLVMLGVEEEDEEAAAPVAAPPKRPPLYCDWGTIDASTCYCVPPAPRVRPGQWLVYLADRGRLTKMSFWAVIDDFGSLQAVQ